MLEVPRIALHANGIFVEVEVLKVIVQVSLELLVMSSSRIQGKAANKRIRKEFIVMERWGYLPPITFAAPLNIFDRLLTTMSA